MTGFLVLFAYMIGVLILLVVLTHFAKHYPDSHDPDVY